MLADWRILHWGFAECWNRRELPKLQPRALESRNAIKYQPQRPFTAHKRDIFPKLVPGEVHTYVPRQVQMQSCDLRWQLTPLPLASGLESKKIYPTALPELTPIAKCHNSVSHLDYWPDPFLTHARTWCVHFLQHSGQHLFSISETTTWDRWKRPKQHFIHNSQATRYTSSRTSINSTLA